MKAKTVLSAVLIVGSVLGVAGGLAYYKYASIQKGIAAGAVRHEPATVVQFAVAEKRPFQRTITAVGTIHSVRHVMLTNELAGKIVHVGFESGEVVEEGQTLLKMDTSTEEADLRSAEASVALAKSTLNRLKTALAGKAVSEQELDRAKAEMEQSLARAEQLRATIAKKEIKAAFRGRVGLRDVHPGQYLGEGRAITSLMGVGDEVHVDFSVPQMHAATLALGAKVTVQVAPGVELPATIVAFDSQIDLSTRNVRVRAELPSMNDRLSPGMSVDVLIPVGPPVDVVVAPPTAIRHAPFGDHLFVLEPVPNEPDKFRARQRFVQVRGSTQGKAIVTGGLQEGERIAADGSFKLREGALVMPAPEKAEAAPALSVR